MTSMLDLPLNALDQICKHGLSWRDRLALRVTCTQLNRTIDYPESDVPLFFRWVRKTSEYIWLLYLFLYNAKYCHSFDIHLDFQTFRVKMGTFGDPFKDPVKFNIRKRISHVYQGRRKHIGVIPKSYAIPLIVPTPSMLYIANHQQAMEQYTCLHLSLAMRKELMAIMRDPLFSIQFARA